MKLGILDAVPPEYLYVDENISDGQKFVDLLNDAAFDGEMVVYNVGGDEFPAHVDSCNAYLITGSPSSVYDGDRWISDLVEFVQVAHARQKPMVGVCFGHQLLAHALGGRVEPSPDGWLLGLKRFTVLEKTPWMQQDSMSCQIYHINKDQVVALPPQARHLGTSDVCEHSMYTIGEHILSIQGHPEQPLRAMRNFMLELGDEVPAAIQEQAHLSFQEAEPDRLMVGNWIRCFLEGVTAGVS